MLYSEQIQYPVDDRAAKFFDAGRMRIERGEAGIIMPPHSEIAVRLRRWIALSGVSRTTNTSLLRSLSITSAARPIRSCDTPEAIRPALPIEQGTMTMAS